MKQSNTAKYYLIVTLFAFILSAILPFFAVYNLPYTNEKTTQLSSIFGSKILVCTAEGFKLINIADIEKNKPQPHPQFKCPICYVSAHGAKNSSASAYVKINYQPTIRLIEFFPNSSAHIKQQLFSNSNQSRAPPYISIVA